MAEFLTTSGVGFHIERIISTARQQLVVISPYLQLSKTLTERFHDADRRKVRITLVYGKRMLTHNDQSALASLRKLSLYFFDNLHAKCYFNESSMIITSMNLYDFSEKTNREMGVLVAAEEEVYRQAAQEARSIIFSAVPQNVQTLETSRVGQNRDRQRAAQQGCCVRCGRVITWNPEAPFCRPCFSVWAQYGDPDYEEQFCHSCGRPSPTSMSKPECYSCYAR